MYIPENYTGKMTHTYIDDEFIDVFTDYNGVSAEVHEKSFIHLEPCEFEMSISFKFLALMMKGIEICNE